MQDEATLEMMPGHDGALLAVRSLGEGRPVFMLHGLASNATINWLRFGTAARIAQAGFRVHAIDQRVHGDSAAPHDPAAYPPSVLEMDAEAVIKGLGLTDFDLVGYSMGARVSASLVARGARPRRLVLGGMGLAGMTAWRKRSAFFLDALDRWDISERGDRDYLTIRFMKTTGIDPVALRLLLESTDDLPASLFDALTMPTLVLSGAQDPDIGPIRELAEALPHADYAEVPGDHMSCVTMPEFGRAIADYLAS